MMNIISLIGYDSNGNPCDYIDDKGTIWIYKGKKNGNDHWEGIPQED